MFALVLIASLQQQACSVEKRPVPDSSNVAPSYPPLLRQAGVGGAVRVTFAVDTNGLPERTAIRIVRSPNAGFDLPVKRVVGSWKFSPALACGRPVRVSLSHEFVFVPGSPDTARIASLFEADTSSIVTHDTLPDGTPRTTLRWQATSIVMTPMPWDSARGDSAEESVVALLIRGLPAQEDGMTRIVCLLGPPGHADLDPSIDRLRHLTRPGVAVLPYRRCPPTHLSMMARPDARPDPPGEDPYHIAVLARQAVASDRLLFDVDVAQGTGGTHYKCGARRHDHGWLARCVSVSSWVS